MAVVRWVGGTSTSMNLGANYSTAALPANSDTLVFAGTPTNAPTTDLNALDAKTALTILVARNWTANIGSATAAAQFGGGATTLLVESLYASILNFDMDAATKVIIANTAPNGRVYLKAGTYANTVFHNGQITVCGATLTAAKVAGPANLTVDSTSGTPTLLELCKGAGSVTCECAITTLDIADGIFRHKGSGAITIGTINSRGGLALLNREGGTYTAINGMGGKVDVTEVSGVARTITNSTLWAGEFDFGTTAHQVTLTNPCAQWGGKYRGPAATINYQPPTPGGAG